MVPVPVVDVVVFKLKFLITLTDCKYINILLIARFHNNFLLFIEIYKND